MLWYSWLMVAIAVIGVLYLIADKFIIPIYRYHQNKKRAATYIWCTFFHPSGSVPQRMLCRPIGAHFIEPPKKKIPPALITEWLIPCNIINPPRRNRKL